MEAGRSSAMSRGAAGKERETRAMARARMASDQIWGPLKLLLVAAAVMGTEVGVEEVVAYGVKIGTLGAALV